MPQNIFQCCKVWGIKNETHSKIDHFVKNPHFLSNPHETWQNYSPHEVIILTNFQKDRTKNADLLLMANI